MLLSRRLLAPALAAASYNFFDSRYSFSCGIMAYIGLNPRASEVILQGLKELQNRGYDSAGIVTVHENNEVRLTKYASDPKNVSDSLRRVITESKDKHFGAHIGIGHTRWATHGGKTDVNSHPHTDWQQRVYIVHNGTIENVNEIRSFVRSHGVQPKGESDTELVANVIGIYLNEGYVFDEAIKKTISQLKGTWGFVILDPQNPQKLYAARHGSPVLIGFGNDEVYIASEQSAFAAYTSEYLVLDDNELLEVDLSTKRENLTRVQVASADQRVSLGNYMSWTDKEINEQPEAISRALNFGGRITGDGAKLGGLEATKQELLQIQNMLILGTGTSLYSAEFGAHFLRQMGVFNTVQVYDSGELRKRDIPQQNAGLIAISQSGETMDTIQTVKYVKSLDIPVLSIVNVVGSSLSRLTGRGVYLNAGIEKAVASTKTFMNSCIVLVEIALWFSANLQPENIERRKDVIDALFKMPILVGSVLSQSKKPAKEVARALVDKQHIFILGSGLAYAIAKEGALKIKEITYTHAEGFAGGALKHGPFALLEDGTPVILIILDDDHKALLNSAHEQVKGRGAHTIVITNDKSLLTIEPNHTIIIEPNGPLSALLAVIPLQLIAYYLSIAKGINPDFPRNLAKVVTVS